MQHGPLAIGPRSYQDGVGAGIDAGLNGGILIRDDGGAGADRMESEARDKNEGGTAKELAGQPSLGQEERRQSSQCTRTT